MEITKETKERYTAPYRGASVFTDFLIQLDIYKRFMFVYEQTELYKRFGGGVATMYKQLGYLTVKAVVIHEEPEMFEPPGYWLAIDNLWYKYHKAYAMKCGGEVERKRVLRLMNEFKNTQQDLFFS